MNPNEYSHYSTMLRYIESDANCKVKAYILRNRLLGGWHYINSMSATATATGISKQTTIKAFEILQKEDFIRKIRPNAWIINPRLIFCGNSQSYKEAKEEYYSTPQKTFKEE